MENPLDLPNTGDIWGEGENTPDKAVPRRTRLATEDPEEPEFEEDEHEDHEYCGDCEHCIDCEGCECDND